jgi:hypothetical protein
MKKEALTLKGRELFPVFKKFKEFYLAGGTGLALQIGHRISIDFDFFTDDFISENLLNLVEKAFSGRKVLLSVNNSEELTVFIDKVKITFLRYPFPLIGSLLNYEGVKIMEAKEIAATKAYTIGRRGSFKDYLDLYFCLRERIISLDEIIGLAEKKYGQEFNARLFLEQLVLLEDVEDTKIVFLKKKISKKEIEKFFREEIGKIKPFGEKVNL